MELRFPEGFYLGASTAAHQVEGNNNKSDFWLMEQLENSMFKEPSNDAVDHYRLYREDIACLAEVGLNAYRFSIEWARIEPEEGCFDIKEINHYRDVLEACIQYGVTPIVTLHHFSSPQWLIRSGGWESEGTPEKFARYCERVMHELGELIPYTCTINEANIAIGIRKIMKRYQAGATAQVGINTDAASRMSKYYEELSRAFGLPPADVHTFLAPRTDKGMDIVFRAHMEAREAIRRVSPNTRVGLTMSLYDIQALAGGEEHAAQALLEEFLQFLPYLKRDDFFGLQNYTRALYGPEGNVPPTAATEKTQMGNEFYPEGLENVIRYVFKHTGMPIMITENGVATEDDDRRIAFINRALQGVQACVIEGIPVLGYMHWSLLDNFEWQLGYSKRFGLISVDRRTQQRSPKSSAYHYGNLARTALLKF